jgi:putative membrane protein
MMPSEPPIPPPENGTDTPAANALPPVIAPPALPPVISAASRSPLPSPPMGERGVALPAVAGLVLQGRLHPFTLLMTLWHAIRGFFWPLLIVVVLGRKDEGTIFYWVMIVVAISLVYSVVHYFTFTYRIENGELITKHGLLGRMERKIPLTRVQDIRLEQRLIHRVLGVVDLQVETAGGKGAEASLSVLSQAEAERLRAAMFAQAGRPAPEAGIAATEARPVAQVLRRLSVKELIQAGLTANYIASALLILLVLWQQLDEILPRSVYERLTLMLGNSIAQWAEQGGGISWAAVLGGGILLVGCGLIFSVVGSVVLFYGFTLSRSGEDLHRSYGLFTRRASSLPRKRIQVLKIEESWLRRVFKFATLRADSAGSVAGGGDQKTGGRDVLLPIIPRQELPALLPEFFPDLPPSPPPEERDGARGLDLPETPANPWRQVSRRAIRRGTVKGAIVLLALTGAACLLLGVPKGLWPLVLAPLVYYLNVLSYRYLGYRPEAGYFWTRHGWLSRYTSIVPVRNTQAVMLHQTPLDRWHRVATVSVDTAGQAYTASGPFIHNVPAADALALARDLAQKAAQTRYRA